MPLSLPCTLMCVTSQHIYLTSDKQIIRGKNVFINLIMKIIGEVQGHHKCLRGCVLSDFRDGIHIKFMSVVPLELCSAQLAQLYKVAVPNTKSSSVIGARHECENNDIKVVFL